VTTSGREIADVLIREILEADLALLARLHVRVFADRFLGYMGERFLRRYYSEFIGREGNHGFVALEGDEPVGFVVGTENLDALYGRFFRRSPITISLLAAWRFIVSGAARRDFFRSFTQFRYAFRSIFAGGKKRVRASEEIGTRIRARLLAIGVAPERRGRGIAESLEGRLRESMRDAGVSTIGLGVDKDNARAIRYYEKNGWQREGSKDDVFYYFKAT
jgi:ribosomal protein S18 acetylase RimI-like enzyme